MFAGIIRWVLVPASILTGWLAFLVVKFGSRWTLGEYFNPEGPFIGFYCELIASLALGAVYIQTAYRVAPIHKLIAAAALMGVLLLLSGLNLAFAILQHGHSSILYTLAMIIGAVASLVEVYRRRSDDRES